MFNSKVSKVRKKPRFLVFCLFPLCKYTHNDQFKAIKVTSLDAEFITFNPLWRENQNNVPSNQKLGALRLCCYLPKAERQDRGFDKELREVWRGHQRTDLCLASWGRLDMIVTLTQKPSFQHHAALNKVEMVETLLSIACRCVQQHKNMGTIEQTSNIDRYRYRYIDRYRDFRHQKGINREGL